jgi:cytoskeletal protein CcmA (bactofilin family)
MPEADIRPVMSIPSNGVGEPSLTVLSEGDSLKGRLEMRGDGHLMGSFEGELDCGGELLVGPDARVAASVRAVHVTISGVVTGNVVARGRLKITATGRLEGDAEVAALVVQEGGVHFGILRVHPEGVPEAHPALPTAVGEPGRELVTQPAQAARPAPERSPVPAAPSLSRPLSASVDRVKKMWGEFF